MTKEKLHFYFGTNGTLLTPVNIIGAQGVLKYHLEAAPGMVLTKDGQNFVESVTVDEEDLELWKEVKAK